MYTGEGDYTPFLSGGGASSKRDTGSWFQRLKVGRSALS